MNIRILYWIVLTFILADSAITLSAQDDTTVFPSGVITDSVYCRGNRLESYSLYLPGNYNITEKWPVILIFDPGARGRLAIEKFVPAGKKFHYILACSNNVRNGNFPTMLSDAQLMYQDVITRLRIDERRIFTAGFSGGSRLATAFSVNNKTVAGVIACGAGLPNNSFFKPPLMTHLVFFGLIGNKDMNYQEMIDLSRTLERSGIPSCLMEFNGLHDWPSAENLEFAVAWIELMMMNKGVTVKNEEFQNEFFVQMSAKAKEYEGRADLVAAARFYGYLIRFFPGSSKTVELAGIQGKLEQTKAFKNAVRDKEKIRSEEFSEREKFEKAMSGIASDKEMNDSTLNWWKYEIHSLNFRMKNDRNKDSLMSFRLLNFVTIACIETGSGLFISGNYKVSSLFFTIWTICEPENKYSWYNLARANAFDGAFDKALIALDRSVRSGFKNKSYILNDKAFGKILNDKRLIRITDRIK